MSLTETIDRIIDSNANRPKLPRSRKHSTRYVVSVRFPDGSTQFLTGHKANENFDTVCTFSDDPEDAISSSTAETLLIGWPYLLWRHAANTGQRIQATIHKLCDVPEFD